ncbi:MurR/RpiR family transcriptional regulator [Mobilicoccus pelagius]|uniref:Putative RpiR family transcriptional regulator n=1 Tax=Mobilicoccus pelagius NBRC 104925 TaxID=1089455 RepID=H5UMF5_9MICO|nr:MurR/RpiR family transcriptional regulator [Mobilicoccus pelagius]GAB46913.1 putative RpiR family transcriptional regulator [Mobilicoccus pelagius NBRC 104925]
MNGVTPTPTPTPLTAALRRVLPTLSPEPRRVAQQILDDPTAVAGLGLAALAERVGTSESTVVRLATSAGYRGYRDLRTQIALAAGAAGDLPSRLVTSDVSRDDDVEATVAKLAAEECAAIGDTAATLDRDALERAADMVVAARSVVVVGIAASGLVALDLAGKLARIGVLAQALVEGHAAMTAAVVLHPDDLLVVVSSSGSTVDVVEPLERARRAGIPTIAVTARPGSPVTAADVTLLSVSARESALRPAAMASRTGQMFVIDVLFTLVSQRTFDRARAAIDESWHALAPRHRRPTGTHTPPEES